MRNYLSYVFLLFLPILGIGLILGGIDEVETLEGETWAMTSQNEVTDFSDQFQGSTAYLSVHDGTADSNDFTNSFFRSNSLNTTQTGDVAGNLLAPNEECTWTVRVWEDYYGDEVDWELRDSDGTVILFGGGYGNGYDDIQTATAEGPLTFWITNDGLWGDNEPNYEVSNANGIILTGQMPGGGATYTFNNLNCEDEAFAECSGIPEGGTATINPDSGPSGSSVNFTVSDYTTDLGITYDWEFSADDGTIWQSVGVGDDDVNLIVNGLHGDELLVRYAVTCTNSGETAYSNVLTFTIDESNCTPSYSSSLGDHIESFVLEDISNLNSGMSTGGYGDFTSMSTDLTVGETYTATLTSGSGSGTHAAAIWIDFNDDGVFEPSEKIGLANDITANSEVEIELEIPADAELGSHTMRVVYQWNVTAENLQPCASASYGEGEDYTVVIVDENGGEPEPGDNCFEVDFADIENGHSDGTSGSSSQWNGNDDFPSVERAYQAGGAVRLGTGSATGFIESRDLNEVEGDITVNIMVKGWTTVEGDLIVSIDGQSETLSYTAVMADDFEMITASFEGVTAGSNLKIETSEKRAFIDNVEIICGEGGGGQPEPEIECPIEYIPSFDDGLGDLSTGIILAADFPVEAGETWSVDNVKVTMLNTVTNVEVSFYADGGNQPGAQILAPTTVVPVSQTQVGSTPNGTPAYELVLDLSNLEISLDGEDSGAMYWVGITTTGSSNFWVYTDTINNDTNFWGSLDGYATWEDVADFGFVVDGAFTVCVTKGALDECSGTPDAGEITGPEGVCPDVAFTLVAEDSTSGFSGLTRQWQSSPTGEDDWTDIDGATLSTYNANDGIVESTDYRFVITCTVSGESAISDVYTVTINDASECYCIPVYSTGCASFGDYLDDFVLNGENGTSINSIGTGCSDGSFDDRTDESVDLYSGIEYTGTISAGTSSNYAAVWVDLNNNGSFEADELVGSTPTSISVDGTTFSILIPGSVEVGEYRMRVMLSFGSVPTDPCNGGSWGETHDYTINVVQKPDCDGTPDAGTVSVTPEQDNPGATYVVSATDYTVAEGITYQWQSNTDGAGWVDEGDLLDAYAAHTATAPSEFGVEVEWRLVVTCTISGESAESDTATFTTELTYCIPTYSFNVEPITRVNVSDIDQSSSAASTLPYEDYTSVEGNMMQGVSYPIALEGNTAGNFTNYFTVWVDWNQNGIFETTEMIEIGTISNSTGTDGQQAVGNINVPVDALTGATRMRVVKAYGSSPTDPCGTYGYGQTEDYTIIVAELEDCTGTPDAGTVTVSPQQGDPGSTYVVSATGYTIANGLTYQWQSNTDGAGWVDEGDATTIYSNYTATAPTGIDQTVDWQLVVTCTISGESATSTTSTFTTVEPGCGFETESNGFEDGFGYMEQAERANDFTVPVNTKFTVNQVKVNMFVVSGTVNAADINFYYDSDEGNGPGELHTSLVSVPPSSMELIGSNFGINVYTLTFDIDNVELVGNTETETVYWMSMLLDATGNTYWEVNYTLNTPNEFYSIDADGNWIPGSDPDYYGTAADGVMDLDGICETLGVSDLNSFHFAYYPNPVRDVLNIASQKAVQSVEVYNLTGQRVMSESMVNQSQIDVSKLTTGTYVFRVTLEDGQVETFKIIKKGN